MDFCTKWVDDARANEDQTGDCVMRCLGRHMAVVGAFAFGIGSFRPPFVPHHRSDFFVYRRGSVSVLRILVAEHHGIHGERRYLLGLA